jgi:hypothetical protein
MRRQSLSGRFFLGVVARLQPSQTIDARFYALAAEKRHMQRIDFTKLLGFETVATSADLDLLDATVRDKLGARVGAEANGSPSKGIDFTNETLDARLGAKISTEVN